MKTIFKGRSSITQKKKNLLHIIYKNGTISTSDLCEVCHMNIATTYRLLDSLVTEGLIKVQRDNRNQNVGRPSNLLTVNPEYLYILAIQIRRATAGIALVDFSNQIVQEEEVSLQKNDGPELLFKKFEKIYPVLLNKQGIKDEKVIGIGLSCIGPMDKDKGLLQTPPFFNNFWDNYPIVKEAEKIFNKKAILDFNACSATIGYYANGRMPKNENLAYIILDEGIGAAVILNSQIIEGNSRTVPSLAHTTVNINGKKCHCGKYGCIERYASKTAILETALLELRLGKKSLLQKHTDDLRFEHICDAILEKDSLSEYIIENAAAYFSMGLCNYVSHLGINTVYIGGSMLNQCPKYYDFVCDRLRELIPELKVNLEENSSTQILKGISTKYLTSRFFE